MTGGDETGRSPGEPAASGAGMLADFGPRLASGIVMIAAALAALWIGGDWFVLFWLVAALVIHWEWQNMIDAPAVRARHWIGGAVLALVAMLARQFAIDWGFPLLVGGCVVLAWLAGPARRLWAAGGIAYAAGLVISLSIIRLSLFDGLEAILWLFAVVWGTDIMAYVGGRLIGGPKLWPRVSPKKTWAGFLTGVFCGALLGIGTLRVFHNETQDNLAALFALGLATAVISQAGDLFESSMKRRFGVKDSSQLIPGHGGFMDRLDGFLVAAVFVALVGAFRQYPGAIAIGILRW